MPTVYCTCEQPVMDVEHDAGCRRCGLPVDFSPVFDAPYVVCASCAHQVTVPYPADRCENCGANATFLRYFADADEADAESGYIFHAIRTRRCDVRFTS